MALPQLEQFDRAVLLHQQGNAVEAAAVYRDVIAECPEHSGAWHLLGVVEHQQGDFAGALDSIGRAIRLDAGQSVFFNNYGAVLQSQKRFVEAVACFRAAIQIKPDYSDAHVNLGGLLEQLGQWKRALKCFEMALAQNPIHVPTLQRAAQLALRLSNFDRAIAFLQKAIGNLPAGQNGDSPDVLQKRAELYADLGNALIGANRADEAVSAYERAVADAPDFATAFFNLASARAEMGKTEDAKLALEVACRLKPENTDWRLRLAVLCPIVFSSNKALDDYRAKLANTLDEQLDSGHKVSEKSLLTTGFFPPFALSFQGRQNRSLKEKFAAVCRPWLTPQPRRPRRTNRVRVGFVVTRGHEGVFLRCSAGIVQHLDRERFEPIVLCDHGGAERLRQGLGCRDVSCVSFGESFREVAEKISAANCDLLYHWEVGSDALNYFLPFMRLAPVQCTSWGTQVTSGLAEVDFYLSSELVDTPEADADYTERLWRLKSFPTYQRRIPVPPATTRDYFQLPDSGHLYLFPQNLLKAHPDEDSRFAQVLRTDPQGILVIKEGRYPYAANQLRDRFSKTMPDVLDRVRFIPWQSLDDFYRLLSVADVILDAVHFSAGSSCYDIFSLNQPIVTLPGQTYPGRYTQACYRRMGFTDLIATSSDDYVSKAVRIASDADYRRQVRQTLAEITPVLFDDLESVREHERFFWEAHELAFLKTG